MTNTNHLAADAAQGHPEQPELAANTIYDTVPVAPEPAPLAVGAAKFPAVRFNVVRHQTGILVKQYRHNNAKVVKDMSAAGGIPAGCTVTTVEGTLAHYIDTVVNGGPRQYALPSNAMLGNAVPMGTKRQGLQANRSADTMRFVAGPAVVTIDHDPSTRGRSFATPDELWAVLLQEFPAAFGGAAHGSYASSSSYIYTPDGTEHAGLRGFHIAAAAEDATDIPRFKDVLFKRLCLRGHGHIFITRDGKQLHRTIFDAKVMEPQQPVFAGGAYCHDGIRQQRPAPVLMPGGYLNTRAIPDLTATEAHAYERWVQAAKQETAVEALDVQREYQKDEVDRLLSRGMNVERARSIVESRLAGTLAGSDELHFAIHGEVLVADVLTDPQKFDECSLHDPLEPDYGSSSTAIFYANDKTTGTAVVFSHAHGGRSFCLRHDESTLRARLGAMDPEGVAAGWARMVVAASLAHDAEERVLAAVRGLTKTPIDGLRKALKAAKLEARQRDRGAAPDPADKLAEEFLKEYYAGGATLIFTETRAFWRYTGTHWTAIAEHPLRGEVQQFASARWDAVCSWFAAQEKSAPALSAFITSVMALLSGKTVKAGDPLRFNSPRPAVQNMKNGELWLEADGPMLKGHRPESYLTSCSDINYDPNAKSPGFDEALRGILSQPGGVPMNDQDEMVRHVEELLGYAAQTERDLKVFMLITGPGDNGKTRLSKLLQLIVGQDAIVFDRLSGIEDNQFSTSKLVGKQILVDDDADHEYLLPDGLLKKIAEAKPLTAERKFEGAFTFVASVVPIILANSWPRTRDLSRGMQTRAQVLHLPRSFKRPEECVATDPDRQRPEVWEQVYASEMPGVVNALLAGYYRVRRRKGFAPPPSARAAFDAWLRDANVVSRFVAEACERTDAKRPGTTTRVLNQVFNDWADAERVALAHRPQANRMRSRFEDLGFKVMHTNRGTAVYGLRPRAEWMARLFEHPEEISEASLQAMELEAEIASAGLSDLL